MRKVILPIILVIGMILSACGNDSGKASSGAEKVQFLLAAEGNTAYYAYVAQENGYFEDEGLDIELVFGKGGTYVVQQVGAETVDIGMTAVSTLFPAWDKDIDIQVVYQLNVKNLFDFMVPAESDITDINQLKGKIIGVTDLGGGEVPMVRSILSNAGLDPDQDVTLRAIGSDASAILTAFDKGEIDAFSGGAHDLVALYASGFKSKSLIPEEYKSLPSSAIVANGKIIKEDPELVEKLTRALARAVDFSIKEPDETFEIMKRVVPEQNQDEEVGRLFLDTFIDLSTPADSEKGYGYIYKDGWETLLQQFKEGDNPVVKNDIDLDKYLNTDFIESANDF